MIEKFAATPTGHRDGPTARREGVDSEFHVLLVGPATEIFDEVADVVRAAGCSVRESWHAADALYLMGAAFETGEPFHAVIVDEALSGVDAELFAILTREDKRFSFTPLILLERGAEGDFGRYSEVGYEGRIGPAADATSMQENIEDLLTRCLQPTAGAELDAESTEDGTAGAPTILVVEDNAINMEVAYEMIRRIGYSCDRAVNGYDAVQAVKTHSYGLVLMDCQLPGMDGYEATSRIRTWETDSGARRVPIVAVTAHAMTGDRERCLAAGMDDYMAKPVEAGGLAALIAKWLTPDATSRENPKRT